MQDNEFELSQDENDELGFVERNVRVPSISPMCYERAYTLKKSNVINLLDTYIEASKQLGNYNPFDLIKTLFEKPWVFMELERLKDVYINKILYNILKNNANCLAKFEKNNIKIHIPVTGIEKIDEPIIQIDVKNFQPIDVLLSDIKKYEFYSAKYVEYCKEDFERFKTRLEEHEEFRESLEFEASE